MSLINCKKCGKLFIKTSRDICNACYENQIKLIEDICNFVKNSDKNSVSYDEILQEFKINSKEFEQLYLNLKLLQIHDKLLVKCLRCNKDFHPFRNVGFVCPDCLKKIHN